MQGRDESKDKEMAKEIAAENERLRQQIAALEAEQLRLQEKILKMSDESYQLRTLIDHLPDYIFIKDRDSRFVLNNRAHLHVLGYDNQDEVVGKSDFDTFPRPLAEQYYADEQRIMESGEPLLDRQEQTVTPEGNELWLSTTKVPLRDPNGVTIGLVGMSRDITARKNAEDALSRAYDQLEQFTYMISYDMQQPLQGIIEDLENLSQRLGGRIGEVSIGIIERATAAAQRLRSLNKDLLIYSRTNTWGTLAEPTDSQMVLEHALESLRERIRVNEAVITHDSLPVVTVDAAQLLELFRILIANAIDYRSIAPPRIHISAERNGDVWRFAVKDNGIGIAPEYSDQIFGLFNRIHDQDEYPGTGIGLAICKQIVERHGGEIGVESAPGEGATFFFTLPVPDEEA